jgi:hypothetical protein
MFRSPLLLTEFGVALKCRPNPFVGTTGESLPHALPGLLKRMADWSIYPPKPLPAESAGSRSGILTQFHEMTERRFSQQNTRVFP